MIIVAGHLRVDPAERDAYLEAVAQVAVRARELPGCHDFVQAADPIDPERINVFERWDDDEASTPDVLGAAVAKYRISAIESP